MTTEKINYPRSDRATVIGGGHGPEIIERSLLKKIRNVFSLTGVSDSGGHTQKLIEAGYIALGDISSRLGVHISAEQFRDLLGRFENKHPLIAGQRPLTTMLARAIEASGDLYKGVALIEDFLPTYEGRVIPITNEHLDLWVTFSGGTEKKGEHLIDEMTIEQGPIRKVRIEPDNYTINPEFLDSIYRADAVILSPGTVFGSLTPLLHRDEVREAINSCRGQVIWFANADNHYETLDWSALDHARHFVGKLGIDINHAFFPVIDFDLPESYQLEKIDSIVDAKSEKSLRAVEQCGDLIKNVHSFAELTILEPYEDIAPINRHQSGSQDAPPRIIERPIIRHDGDFCAEKIFEIIDHSFSPIPQNGAGSSRQHALRLVQSA